MTVETTGINCSAVYASNQSKITGINYTAVYDSKLIPTTGINYTTVFDSNRPVNQLWYSLCQ